MNVLVLNAGSSSLKFKLLRAGEDEKLLAEGLVEKWGSPQASLKLSIGGEEKEDRTVAAESAKEAVEHAIKACIPMGIDALGHRVVHGGPHLKSPVQITRQVIAAIDSASELAPLHNKQAIAGIEAGLELLPQTPAVAVFDTSFHWTMPDEAAQYALPLEFARKHHLRRYGFHGISHQFVSQRLLECLGRPAAGSRLITCHLGNGASICALRDGKSIDTSMGLTPMEGLVMGTRSGDIDPGLVLHLMSGCEMTSSQVEELLNRKSGLLGLSGRSGDMRDLEQSADAGGVPARAAISSFAYRAKKYIGAYAAALGGIDAVAFTGGIGEHSARVRSLICDGLDFLDIEIDPSLNANAADLAARISSNGSRTQVWMIRTDEERQIARETSTLLAASPGNE